MSLRCVGQVRCLQAAMQESPDVRIVMFSTRINHAINLKSAPSQRDDKKMYYIFILESLCV